MTTIPSIKLANTQGQIFLIGKDGFLDNPMRQNDFNVRSALGKWEGYSAARIDKDGTHVAVEDNNAIFNLTAEPSNIWIAAGFSTHDVIINAKKDSQAPSLSIDERELQNPAANTLEVSVDDMSDTSITYNITKLSKGKLIGSGNGEVDGNLKVTKTFANAKERDAWLNAVPPQPVLGPVSVVSNDPALTPPDNIISRGTEPAITTADLNKSVKLFKDGMDADENKLVVPEPTSLQQYKELISSGQRKPDYDKVPSYSGNIENHDFVKSVMTGASATAVKDQAQSQPTGTLSDEEKTARNNERGFKKLANGMGEGGFVDKEVTAKEAHAALKALHASGTMEEKAMLAAMSKRWAGLSKLDDIPATDYAALAPLVQRYNTAHGVANSTEQPPQTASNSLNGVMTASGLFVDPNTNQLVQDDKLRDDFQKKLLEHQEKLYGKNGVSPQTRVFLSDGRAGKVTKDAVSDMFKDQPDVLAAYKKSGPAIFFEGGEFAGKFETMANDAIAKAEPVKHREQIHGANMRLAQNNKGTLNSTSKENSDESKADPADKLSISPTQLYGEAPGVSGGRQTTANVQSDSYASMLAAYTDLAKLAVAGARNAEPKNAEPLGKPERMGMQAHLDSFANQSELASATVDKKDQTIPDAAPPVYIASTTSKQQQGRQQ